MDHGLLHGLGKLVGHITAAAVSCLILSWIASGDYLSDEPVVLSSPQLFCYFVHMFAVSTRYLDQLGQSAKYDTKVYCRQTLIGGNYGLLDTDTFVPNPDYYRQVSVMNTPPQTCFTTSICIGLNHSICSVPCCGIGSWGQEFFPQTSVVLRTCVLMFIAGSRRYNSSPRFWLLTICAHQTETTKDILEL